MMQAKEKAPQTAAAAQGATKENDVQNQSTADRAVCQAPEIRGFQFLGYIANKRTNRRLVPLYKPQEPTDGQPSINTLEGWNFFYRNAVEKQLQKQFSRKPTDAEIQDEMNRQAAEAERLIAELETRESHES
mgnify:FL=1